MQGFRDRRFFFIFIIWIQIFVLVGTPLTQNLVLADVAATKKSKEFFDDYFGQRFILNHPPQVYPGILNGILNAESRIRQKLLRALRILPKNYELSTTETIVDFEKQPIETLVPLGINLKNPKELKIGTYLSDDGTQKPELRFERAHSDYNNSRYEFTSEKYDIISVVENENLGMFLNRDGTIYGLDKTNPLRNFGKSYVGIFPIAKIEIEEGAKYELRYNLGPFSRGDLPLTSELQESLKGKDISLGSLLVIRDAEISSIVSDADQLKGLILPTVAIAVATEREKSDVAISLAELHDEYSKFIKEHEDFFGTAKSQEIIGKIRSIDGGYISQAFSSLGKQVSMLNESRSFSLDAWIQSGRLQLTSTSKEILETIFSKEKSQLLVLENALQEFKEELSRQLSEIDLPPELRIFFGRCIQVLESNKTTNEKISNLRLVSDSAKINWADWLNAEATEVSEPAELVLGSVLNAEDVELWEPSDKIVAAALYELMLKLEIFLKNNVLHPQEKEIKSIISALEGLKRSGSSKKLKDLTEELRKLAESTPNISLLDLIAAASIDQNSVFKTYATETKLVHPKNIPFMKKVKSSKFMKHFRGIQEAIFTGPNLLMGAGFASIYLGNQFTPEYTGHLSLAWAYHFGFLQLLIGSFWAYGRFKAKNKDNAAAVGMSSIGIPLYGGLLSVPTGIMWAKLSAQENYTYAITHGVFPTTENGGYLTVESDIPSAREKLLATVQERETKLATLQLEAFRAVADIHQIQLSSTHWSEMQNEWQEKHIEKYKAQDTALDEELKEAELSGDPKKLASKEAEINLIKFRRALEFREFQEMVQNAVALVTNQLDSIFSDYPYSFSEGLAASQLTAVQETAKKYALDSKQKAATPLKIDAAVYGARAFFKNNFARVLAWPLSSYRAAQQAVIRPEIARVVYSNWRTDMVVQYLLDGAWNGYPIADPLKSKFNYTLPTRSNPLDPNELFAQPGNFMHTHHAENANLFQQVIIYSAASTTRAQSEMGKPGSSIKNLFADNHIPEEQKQEPFFKSLKRFYRNAFKLRKIGTSRYLDQSFKNTFRYAQPAFLIEAIATGLVGGYPFHKIVAQYLFFRGLGMWSFGWPWIPLNLGMAAISEISSDMRKAFVTSRLKYLEAVEAKNWTAAKLYLIAIKKLYDANEEKFEALEKLGARTVESLTEEELNAISLDLVKLNIPFFAEPSHMLNDVTSFVGGVTTTALGVPFFVVKASFPMAWWKQSLVGIAGLMMYPVAVAGMNLYDKKMKRSRDQIRILKDGEKEAERLSDPHHFAYEVSARILARETEEEIKLKKEKDLSDSDRAARLLLIKTKYQDARGRMNEMLTKLKAEKAKNDNDASSGGTSTHECMTAIALIR